MLSVVQKGQQSQQDLLLFVRIVPVALKLGTGLAEKLGIDELLEVCSAQMSLVAVEKMPKGNLKEMGVKPRELYDVLNVFLAEGYSTPIKGVVQ